MPFINIEIKARTVEHEKIRKLLVDHKAHYTGRDSQTDTYFAVSKGRLKLRQGVIENNLIAYHREESHGTKHSDFDLYPVTDAERLLSVLTQAMDPLVIVKKKRDIFYIGNVKFHLDTVDGLGQFVEIEASNKEDANLSVPQLKAQCEMYCQLFEIRDEDFIAASYSDMIMEGLSTTERSQLTS